MSILTKEAIKIQIGYGNIVIEPYHEGQLGPNGYDLHLGKRLFKFEPADLMESRDGKLATHVPVDIKKDLTKYYKEVFTDTETRGWLLKSNTLYLGVTLEYTEAHAHIPQMEGKSSLGRIGLESHVCAGFGDIGFCGYWTLEIRVTEPTIIYPGMPIGQLVWHTAEGVTVDSYRETGSYNNARSENPAPGIPNLWKKTHQFLEI